MFVTGIFVGIGLSFIGGTIGYFAAQYTYAKAFNATVDTLMETDSEE